MINRIHIKVKYKNLSHAMAFLVNRDYKFFSEQAALNAISVAVSVDADAVIYLTIHDGKGGKSMTWSCHEPILPGTVVKWSAIKALARMDMLK